MSEETKVQTPAKAKAKKKNIFVRMGRAIARWFREMRSELKKVVWPTPKQIVNNTLVVLVIVVVSAIVLWGFDSLASAATELLIAIGG